ncbi:hypothetical protein IAD21_06310 [Abditibacteriota bacterium]|nr:hypothetical protein IAD21_06310 [Abditibacteriota bacterium]
MNNEKVHQLRAVESLRSGVPSRDVVRFFPPEQRDVATKWENVLEVTTRGEHATGLLLEGDFGTGKSHWLEHMKHLAGEANFVSSTVVLNKETPLHELAKLLRAAVESATLPGRSGPALSEIAFNYRADTAPGYTQLFEWVHGANRDPRLALTLLLFERTRDEEVRERVIAEWMGDAMTGAEFRVGLRESGMTGLSFPKPRKDNFLEKFEFLARFFQSAGYGGWVLLLDEAEMISKYSQRQRGRSYAHLAQLLGDSKSGVKGLACAATITKDYAGQVLYGRKNDMATIPVKMENTRDEGLAAAAIGGMRFIERGGSDLRPMGKDGIERLFEQARGLYSQVYDWEAPPLPNRREYSSSTSMRQHLRWWINAWDLLRLYGHQGETIVEAVAVSYEEDTDMQTESPGDESRIVL